MAPHFLSPIDRSSETCNNSQTMAVMSILIFTLIAIGYSQKNICMYTANDGKYTLNLTEISDWTLEYQSPGRFFYYSPCRNGVRCEQGATAWYGNTVENDPKGNQCLHYLSIDHKESAQYSFIGAAWRFSFSDGELCDQTQQPRTASIYYHCNDVNNQSPAYLETAYEVSGMCQIF